MVISYWTSLDESYDSSADYLAVTTMIQSNSFLHNLPWVLHFENVGLTGVFDTQTV